ncbi:MAG: ComF family protein [bacterium]|nr:ComF family protein [bacterium]
MSKILTFFLDIIFPKFCLGCNTEGIWLCQKCFKSIKRLNKQCCPVCRKKNFGETCNNCKEQSSIDGLIVSASYDQTLIQKIIHYYKYQYIKELYQPLGALLLNTINTNNIINNKKTIIISIPLHKKRQLERGYNQSTLLAKYIAKKLNLPYYDQLIIRKKNTEIQAHLLKKERLLNLNGAFKIKKNLDFHGKNVIIVDDVATTLATLNSCARLLKRAGATEIWGLVIARGSYIERINGNPKNL